MQRMLTLGAVAAIALLFATSLACRSSEPVSTPTPEAAMGKPPDQLFAAHFVDSYPNHGDVFGMVPDRVQIDFNFTLHEVSSITVTRNGQPLTAGKLNLGPRNLAMWTTLPAAAGDGLYVVEYKACWPDRSCHDGRFGFAVDSKLKASYVDLSGKREVQIEMQGTRFQPNNVVISKGTKVVWTNREATTHFVNTDPHPSHNVVPELNSLDLKQGQSFSFTFDQLGEWGYHCSAHFPQGMVARVIVQP